MSNETLEPQAEQFAEALKHMQYAYANSAYYRKAYDEAGLEISSIQTPRDFSALPFVSKSLITADQRDYPPYGSVYVNDADPPARVLCSGGSILLALSQADLDAVEGMYAEMFALAGVRAGDLVDLASGYHWVFGGTIMDAAFRRLGAGVIPGGPGLTELRVQVLSQTGATVLQAFTPYADTVGNLIKSKRGAGESVPIAVRLLIVGGELRTSGAKDELQQLWGGAGIREAYGASEVGMTAIDCEQMNGMHLNSKCYLEIVDPVSGDPVATGQPGEIVMTELNRASQPFIRFRTGDICTGLTNEPCGCGRTSARLGQIIGRKSDVVRVRGQFLSQALIESCTSRFSEIGAWHVAIERVGASDSLRLQVAPPDVGSVSDWTRDELLSSLKQMTPLSFDLTTVPAADLPSDAPWFTDLRQQI